MAERAIIAGVDKTRLPAAPLLLLAVLAGAFMGLGALFSLAVVTGAEGIIPYGITRLLAGLAFAIGPILVAVGGAELFTANNLMVMAWADRRVRTREVLRAWVLVYAGNAVGAVTIAALAFAAGDYMHSGGALGRVALTETSLKASLSVGQAFIHGMAGNAVICLAVWLSYSARTTTDKIVAMAPLIAAFVTVGFEHSIANMFLMPFGTLIHHFAPADFLRTFELDPALHQGLELPGIVRNVALVSVGNVVGGLTVGLAYWAVYRRRRG
ncbi:MAG: formate/nitrite transporter family protein [Alphaproteobacteria bacterium]